jgi:hypothetical protein
VDKKVETPPSVQLTALKLLQQHQPQMLVAENHLVLQTPT